VRSKCWPVSRRVHRSRIEGQRLFDRVARDRDARGRESWRPNDRRGETGDHGEGPDNDRPMTRGARPHRARAETPARREVGLGPGQALPSGKCDERAAVKSTEMTILSGSKNQHSDIGRRLWRIGNTIEAGGQFRFRAAWTQRAERASIRGSSVNDGSSTGSRN
jgi:hypothetical protein